MLLDLGAYDFSTEKMLLEKNVTSTKHEKSFGLGTRRSLESFETLTYFDDFWVREPRHSEKCYLNRSIRPGGGVALVPTDFGCH